MKILAINGSPNTAGLNATLLAQATSIATQHGAEVTGIDFVSHPLPFYSPALQDAGFPESVEALRLLVEASDGLLIAQPEHNFSIPAALKNFIDWLSRFRPQPFRGKHAFLMSASPSMVGGNRGLWQLRVPIESLGVHTYPGMFSLAQAKQAFNEDGTLVNEAMAERLENNLVDFFRIVEATR